MSKKKIFIRYGFTDLIVENNDDFLVDITKYTVVKDQDGKTVGEIEASFICYEDENGDECNEDGSDYEN